MKRVLVLLVFVLSLFMSSCVLEETYIEPTPAHAPYVTAPAYAPYYWSWPRYGSPYYSPNWSYPVRPPHVHQPAPPPQPPHNPNNGHRPPRPIVTPRPSTPNPPTPTVNKPTVKPTTGPRPTNTGRPNSAPQGGHQNSNPRVTYGHRP